ncbi:MAG: hypothetical protein ABSH38_21755 [Verrucomicrobiota bacterium]|jgi:hypothetical protein
MRHGFVSFHFAMNANESLTAAEAGNSPAMIHAHYNGLAIKAEAQQGFELKPEVPTNILATQGANPHRRACPARLIHNLKLPTMETPNHTLRHLHFKCSVEETLESGA